MKLLDSKYQSISLWDYTGFDGFCYITVNNIVFAVLSYINPQGRELTDILDMDKIKLYIASGLSGDYKKKPYKWHGSDFKLRPAQ